MDCDFIYNFMLCKHISLIRTFDGKNKPHSYSGGVSSEWYAYYFFLCYYYHPIHLKYYVIYIYINAITQLRCTSCVHNLPHTLSIDFDQYISVFRALLTPRGPESNRTSSSRFVKYLLPVNYFVIVYFF